MMMQSSEAPTWPKRPDGTTDWEMVFEASDSGLISLISAAHSAKALRECTIVVIQQLHTRKNDPEEVARFVGELNALVPDSLPAAALPRVTQALVSILRKIKDDRIARAEAYVAAKAAESIKAHWQDQARDEARAAAAEPEDALNDNADDRRVESVEVVIPNFSFEEEEKPAYGLYGGIAAAVVAVIGLAAYLILGSSSGDDFAESNKLFMQQMHMAADGNGPPEHVFGGNLSVGILAGRPAVTADSVPSENCQSVSWSLAARGNVMISGVMPKNVAPMVLKDLCSRKLLGATLIWLPQKKRKR